ncbi:MAG: hypothetical protein DWQ05_02595 [Calditrichaeota bacterium]|nr:MAG: hypothetical protein DWQ05_02595 [Calditrichota bacterium]
MSEAKVPLKSAGFFWHANRQNSSRSAAKEIGKKSGCREPETLILSRGHLPVFKISNRLIITSRFYSMGSAHHYFFDEISLSRQHIAPIKFSIYAQIIKRNGQANFHGCG